MAIRKAAALFSVLFLGTACTAILGVEDVPSAAPKDGGTSVGEGGGDGGGGGETGPANAELAAATTSYASAFCRKLAECSPTTLAFTYATAEKCAEVTGGTLAQNTTAPGAAATAAEIRGCETRIAALGCDVFQSSDSNFVCALKGTRKQNDRCTTNFQCESGLCGSDLKVCRGCIPAPAAGDPCPANFSCGPGLVCNGTSCVVPSTVDQGCSPQKPCNGGLVCSAAGVCERLPDTANAPCDVNVGCDFNKALFCFEGTCVNIAFAGVGQACGAIGDKAVLCYRNTTCDPVTNTCPPPPARVGDACGANIGQCELPLYCDNGTCVAPPTSSFCE